jgi:hypothetical protein
MFEVDRQKKAGGESGQENELNTGIWYFRACQEEKRYICAAFA